MGKRATVMLDDEDEELIESSNYGINGTISKALKLYAIIVRLHKSGGRVYFQEKGEEPERVFLL